MAHSTLRTFFALAAWTVTVAALPAQSQTTPPTTSQPQATQPPATADTTMPKKTRSKRGKATDPSAAAAPAATPAAAGPAGAQPATTAPPQKGMVWVNTASGAYHSEGTKYYGKTKQGKYMTEADAQKAGYHAAKEKGKS